VNIPASITRPDSAGGPDLTRTIPTPFLGADLKTKVTSDEQEITKEHDPFGRQFKQTVAQPGGDGSKETAEVKYLDAGADIQRGKVRNITRGDSAGESRGTSQSIGYAVGTGGGETVTVTDDIRGTVTTVERDSYDRPTLQRIVDASGTVMSEERFGYDSQGRLLVNQRKQTGVGGDDQVRTTMTYDVAGRLTHTTLSKAKVGESIADVETKVDYDLGSRTTTAYDPFVGSPTSFVVSQNDPLGRAEHVQHRGGTNVIDQFFGYDRAGELAYVTDRVRLAELHQHDSRGRETLVLRSDGTRTQQAWDAWDQLINVKALAAPSPATPGNPERLAEQHFLYSAYGRPRGVSRGFIGASYVATRSQFSFGGQTEITRIGKIETPLADLSSTAALRTTRLLRDSAGRVISQLTGEGQAPQLPASSTFSGMNVTSFLGDVPNTVEILEPIAGAKYLTSTIFDGLGRVKEVDEANSSYVSTSDYDEAGNVVKSQPSGYQVPWARSYDARGRVTEERAPEGTTVLRQYDARGTLRVYHDEAGKDTRYDTDDLGRVTTVTHAGTTTEQLVYENQTGAVASRKDRKGQWFSYFYDSGGRIVEVRFGGPRDPNPATQPTGTPYLRYAYDFGGRLRVVISADAATEYDEYDLLGRPGITRQIRYRDRSGLSGSPVISDAHTQKHIWTIFDGERERWRMPAAGTRVPDSETASPWRTWIVESHDGAGNITHQQIADYATATAGASITRASGRGVGRLVGRTRFFGIAGNAVEQTYGYADGLGAGSAPGPASGLLGKSTIAIGSFVLAGSEIARDTAQRQEISKDLGLSARATNFGYDNRGRLTSSELLGEGGGSVTDTLVPADFRHNRTVKTDARDLAELGSLASQFAVPSWSATQTDLHQYDTRTVANEPAARTYTFDAGRRTSDGSWTSEYDPEGRVTALQRGSERIEFTYGPTGRLVGRHAFKNNGAAWENEDRPSILDADGLPADTTFVWDPVVDRLLAIFEASQSVGNAPAPDAGLVRQYLHGDQGYDDPVEVSAKRNDGPILRYLPVVDEAGSGSVQAVVAASGLLAERVLYGDAYGDAPRYLQGPVVDKIEIGPAKAGDGSLSSVTMRVRLSETVDVTTISSGLRVSAIDSAGSVVAAASGAITASGNTVSMQIAGAVWSSFAATPGATQIEIAVTNTLRAAVWDGPVMPLTAWLLQNPSRSTTPQFPVIQRESFASLTAFVAGLRNGESRPDTLMHIHDLFLAASPTSVTKLFTGYKSAPFIEPRTGFAYFRNRWYSPNDGTWLTPDEMAFADGSNSYAAMACNPIQNSDPTGTLSAKSIAAMKAASIRTVEGAVIGIGVAVGATLSAPVTATAAAAIGIYNLGKNIYHREQQYDALGWGDHWVEAASVGLGDTIGMTGFVEGTADRELVSGRDLSEEEAGERLGDSIGQQVGVLAATALYRPVQSAVRTSSPYRQFSRDLAAAALRDARTGLAASGVAPAKINSYMRAFEFESIRYGREFNFWSRHYRFYSSGGSAGGRWLTDDIGLLDESPFGRKVSLALPASNAADAAAWTRIPLGRYVLSGVTAPRPPSFTGLPSSALTGGPRQQYVISFPGQSYLHFTVHP
jgi:RHS repeat-associated protein